MISTYKNVQKQSLFLTVLGQSKKKEEKIVKFNMIPQYRRTGFEAWLKNQEHILLMQGPQPI